MCARVRAGCVLVCVCVCACVWLLCCYVVETVCQHSALRWDVSVCGRVYVCRCVPVWIVQARVAAWLAAIALD